jgi:hypothetical protein
MFYSGIDQHKRDCFITTYDSDGAMVKQKRVPNSPMLIRHYFGQLPGLHKAVVESTGSWYWLADLLEAQGVDLSLAHATRLKAISEAKVKTNKIDSDVLAMLLYADVIPEAHMIRPEMRGPRDLMRTRLRLVERCTSCKNSIERLLEKFNVKSVTELDELYRLQAACHEAQIELLHDQIGTLEAALHPHLIPNPDIQRLLWIPGIGKVNAFTLYTEIDGVLLLLPAGPRRRQHRRPHPSPLRLEAGQPLPQARLRPRRRPGHAVLPRGPRLLSRQEKKETRENRPHPRRSRDRPHRLSRAERAGRFQRTFQG